MISKIAHYTVKSDELDAADAAVGRFLHQVTTNEPQTHYQAFRICGTLSFVHLMQFPDAVAEQHHKQAYYTQKFVEELYPHCSVTPYFENLDEMGVPQFNRDVRRWDVG
jgi:quinol monooxygenase YgiN